MKKRLVTTITVLCLLCGFFVPVRAHADTATYAYISTCEDLFIRNNNYIYTTGVLSGNDVRVLFMGNSGSIVKPDLYMVSTSPFTYTSNSGYYAGNQQACSANVHTSDTTQVVDGITYYYVKRIGNTYNSDIRTFYIPYIQTSSNISNAIYYTFGAGAVDPAPPAPDYGDLIDVRFNTDIAGSGTAAVNNIDRIKWNPDNDSNGITFDGSERVEIRAIAGNYTAESRNSLLSLGVTDFDYNSGSEHQLAELPVKNGEYTVSWSHVIQQLNAGSISDFLGIRKSSDTWLKSGWIYQIRLVSGNYQSAWQTIYNATSSGVENSLTVENSTEINTNLINVIQSINTINSSENESWTINNITINMENSDGQQTTDKPWWAYLLEAIVKSFGDILAFLGNLIGNLMDAITDLFKPAEFTINEYNDFKVDIKQNSGLFGQAIDFTTDLKNTFMGVQYQEPILHWQGISFDGIVFLPAADYNLNEYVTMWGLGDFRQIAYICSDGFIFFSLLLLIIRKLNEVLKK